MKTRRRLTTVAAATAAFAMLGSAAFAHECMVMNRSEQSNKALAHSPMWLSENMATHEAYEFTFIVAYTIRDGEVGPITEQMLDAAVEEHEAQGLQEWASFFLHHTLLTDPKSDPPVDNPAATKHAGDGKGVDHWSDTELGQAMIQIATDLLPPPPSA